LNNAGIKGDKNNPLVQSLVKTSDEKTIYFHEKEVNNREPFRCSSPAKAGYNKSIGKYPEYISDPIKKRVR